MEPERAIASPSRISLWPLALLGTAVALLSLLRSSRERRKDATKSKHPQNATKKKGDNVNQSVKPDIPPSPTQCRYPEGSKDNTPLWKKFVEITLAVSTAGLLIINIFLWCSTKKSATAAEKANKFSLRVFENNERAVVIPDAPEDFLDQGVIKVRMKNYGKRAAGPFFLWVVPTRWKKEDSSPVRQAATESGTFRPDARRIPGNGGYLDFSVPIEGMTNDDATRIRQGTEKLLVSIAIDYNDGFGKKGTYNATFQYAPKIGWVSNTPTYRISGAEKVPDIPED